MADDIQSNIRINIDTSVGIAEIKQLQRQISQLNAQLLQSGAQQSKSAQNIQRNLINNINATGKFAANVKTISTTAESFTNALERNKLGFGETFRYAGASTKTFGRLFKSEFATIEKVARERVKTIQTQFVKLGRDGSGAMKAIAVRPLALDMDNLATKTAVAAQRQQLFNQLLKQGSTNLLNFGKNTQWAGRQLMVGFTLPLAMAGAAAAKAFMAMEEQAIKFRRVYGDSFTPTEETDKMIKQVEQLAKGFTKYGVQVEKTMEAAASAAAMGLMGADLMAQISESTRLSVLGSVEQEQALSTTISLMNAFGTSAQDLAKDIDFLNAVENQTVVAIEDLTIAIPKAAPVIKQLGGDVQDLAFFLTAMKEGGINASEGANALKSGLASMINPAEKTSKFLADLGINIKGIVDSNAGDVKGTVIAMAEALDTLDPLNRARAIEQLFGKFQFSRISTLFQNVVKEGTQAQRVLEITKQSSAELAILSERELGRVEDSPLFKFKKAVEDLKVALVPLGEAFLKAITPVIEFGKGILDQFNNLSDGTKNFVVLLTTIVGGIGPVLLMGFGLVANGVANLIKLFAFMGKAFGGAKVSSANLATSTEYLTQQQLEASAVAASLDQSHAKLIQTFNVEAASVDKLATAYGRAVVAQARLLSIPIGPRNPGGQAPMKLKSGIVSVPGPKGAGDIVPAMLSPGEAVIPAKQTEKYSGLIRGMINDDIPGFRIGRLGAAARSFGSKAAEKIGNLRVMRGKKKTGVPEWDTLNPGGNWSLGESVVRTLTKKRSNYGPTTTTYENELFDRFIRSTKRRKVAVRMFSDDLTGALTRGDKRYQSVFERGGTSRGSGDMAGGQRAIAEKQLFGLDFNAPAQKRPAYGYLFGKEKEVHRVGGSFGTRLLEKITGNPGYLTDDKFSMAKSRVDKATRLMNEDTYRYGDVAMILKNRAIAGRTTITRGDSLNHALGQMAQPARLGTRNRQSLKAARTSRGDEFFEAQIMGGFSFKDIKRMVATEPGTVIKLQQALKAAGIRGIKVGMPRYTMMQKLQRLVYGKKNMYEQRLPKMQPPDAGPIAGKYRPDPLVINGRKFYNKGVLDTTPDAQPVNVTPVVSKPTSMNFDPELTLQQSHMAPGISNLNEKNIIENIKRQVREASPDLIRSGKNPKAIEAQLVKIAQSRIAAGDTKFRLYSSMVEPQSSLANQSFTTETSQKLAKDVLQDIRDVPKGYFGSGLLARLPSDHNLDNKVVSKYALDLTNSLKNQLNAKGQTTAIREDELHRMYANAVKKAEGQIANAADKELVERTNRIARAGLNLGYQAVTDGPQSAANNKNSQSVSAYTRRGPMALWGDVQNKSHKLLKAGKDGTSPISRVFGERLRNEIAEKYLSQNKVQGIVRSDKNFLLPVVNLLKSDKEKGRAFSKEVIRIHKSFSGNARQEEFKKLASKYLPKEDFNKIVAKELEEKTAKPIDTSEVKKKTKTSKKPRSTSVKKPTAKVVQPTTATTVRGPRGTRIKRQSQEEPIDLRNILGIKIPGFKNGVVSVPGPKGRGDVVPAMLSPGEAVIPTKMADKYAPLINSMISDSVPGYNQGRSGNKKKGGFRFDPNFVQEQPQRRAPAGKVTVEQRPTAGVVSERRTTAGATQQEAKTLARQLKGNPFRRGINAITTNITGAIATGIQNANLAKVMAKDYAAGVRERYKEDRAITRRQEKERAQEMQRRAAVRQSEKFNKRFSTAAEAKMSAGKDGGTRFHDQRPGQGKGGFLGAPMVASRIEEFNQNKKLQALQEKQQKRQEALQKRSDKRLDRQLNSFNKKYKEHGITMARSASGASYHGINPATGKQGILSRDEAKSQMAAANKDIRAQKTATRKEAIGKGAAGATGLGMAAMMYGMSGGPGAEIAAQAALPLMLAPLIAPMLTNPIGLVVLGLAAVAGIAYKLQEDLNNVRKESASFAKAMSSGAGAMQSLAEFAGTVSPTETMNRIRAERRSGIEIVAGKSTFGGNFLQSDSGKELLKQAQNSKLTDGGDDSSRLIATQLSQAVASNVLTPGQAASIADNLGQAMNDYDFSVDVQAKMIELLGPGGEDLTKNPITVFARIVEDRRGTVAGRGAAKDVIANTSGSLNIGSGIRGNTAEAADAEIQIAQLISDIADMNQQNLDTLELEHLKRLETLEAAGDLAGMEEERNKYAKDRANLVADGARQMRAEIKYISDLETSGNMILRKSAEQIVDNMENSLESLFDGFEGKTKERNQEAIRDISDNTDLGLTFAEKASILAVVSVENIDLYKEMLETFPPKEKENAPVWKKIAQMSVEMGSGTTEDMFEILKGFTDKTKGTQFMDYVLNLVTTGKLAEADNAMQTMAELNKIKLESGEPINLDKFIDADGNVTEKFKNITTALDKLDAAFKAADGKSITYKILTETTGIQLSEQAQKLFDSLPPDQQKRYVTAYLTITESIDLTTDEGKARLEAHRNKLILESGGAGNTSVATFYRNMSNDALKQDFVEQETEKRVAADGTRLAPDDAADDDDDDDDDNNTKKADPFTGLLQRLKAVRAESINTAGGLNEIMKVLGKNKNITAFDGLSQNIARAGGSSEFIDFVQSLESSVQKQLFQKNAKGITILTEKGKALQKAFNKASIGEYQDSLRRGVVDSNNQVKAFNKLIAGGMSYSDAMDAVSDATLAAAVASKSFSSKELKSMVAEANRAEAALRRLEGIRLKTDLKEDTKNAAIDDRVRESFFTNAGTKFDELQQAAILSDPTLLEAYKRSLDEKVDLTKEFTERLAQVVSNPEFQEKFFNDAFGMAMEAFSVLETQLTLDFELGTNLSDKNKDKVALEPIRQLIEADELKIEGITDKIQDYEDGLFLISEEEDRINKSYDQRIKALDEVQKINEDIARQQRAQLTLADAITSGDMSAAARAVQETREANAAAAAQSQKDMLEKARESDLKGLTTSLGGAALTREQIEEKIKLAKRDIFNIESGSLKANLALLDAGEKQRDVFIKSLEVVGLTRLEWEGQKSRVDAAKISAEGYNTVLAAALGSVSGIVLAWQSLDGKTIKTTHEITTVEAGTPGAGNGVGTPADNMDKAGAILTIKTLREQNLVEAQSELAALGNIEEKIANADRYARQMANAGKMTEAASAIKTRDSLQKTLDAAIAKVNKIFDVISDLMLRFGLASPEFTATRDPNASVALANGGFVSGKGTATSDSIPALLSNGEYVINAKTTKKIGTDFLNAVNFGNVAGFSDGGSALKKYGMGGRVTGYSQGGSVLSSMFRAGGLVMSKYGVQNYGVDRMKSPNSGTYKGDSVYNYEVNVKVQTDSNPDQIARAVLGQIKQIDAQRIRGNRY